MPSTLERWHADFIRYRQQMLPDSQVHDRTFGFRCWSGVPAPMARAHRHDDIEVNVAVDGELVYLFGGATVRIGPGQMAAFWAAMPHQLVACTPYATVCWLTVPLPMFLGWPFPDGPRTRLLRVRPLVGPGRSGQSVVADADRFDGWMRDLSAASAERHEIAALEIQARLRRLALDCAEAERDAAGAGGADPAEPAVGRDDSGEPGQVSRELRHAAAMAGFVARHYAEPIDVAGIAGSCHLHPHYAMTVFRRVVGTTVGRYLRQCRVAQAQRLLVSSDLPVAEIAAAAGFTSASRFYADFAATCDSTPGGYRRAARAAGR